MAQVHQLIEERGREAAKEIIGKPAIIDAASRIMSIEEETIGVTYSGFALTSLPHRRLADSESWVKNGSQVNLLIEPGKLPNAEGGYDHFGVPYGAQARLMMIYLQTQAVKNKSQEIELGRNMYDWLNRMGVSIGGKTYKMVRNQGNRLSACHMTFSWKQNQSVAFERDSIIKGGIFLPDDANPNQASLWNDTVILSDRFYNELTEHAVPISEEAIAVINNKSISIDIYIWLAYRLHSLSRPQLVTWKALQDQFGGGYARLRDFRKRFIESLELSLAVYRDAHVDIHEQGLTLHPSRPPITEKTVHYITA